MSTLTKMTKAQLIELAQAQGAQITDLRNQLSVARAQRDSGKSAVVVRGSTTHALPAHFAAAREAAMRLGRSVKVGV